MHTCIHAYMHPCIHACIHAYVHTYMHEYVHTYICSYMYMYMYIERDVDKHSPSPCLLFGFIPCQPVCVAICSIFCVELVGRLLYYPTTAFRCRVSALLSRTTDAAFSFKRYDLGVRCCGVEFHQDPGAPASSLCNGPWVPEPWCPGR